MRGELGSGGAGERGLTARQRAALKALAHSLKPIQHIGKEGVTDALVGSVQEALHTRELLKLKVLEVAPGSARGIADELANRIEGAHVVQVIGRTVVVYRRHPERPRIVLPR
ncbi:MAG: YhbY family RNA-binding protein [Gemmatimonadota bacterium]